MMSLATKILTPQEFLGMDPGDHPDFLGCDKTWPKYQHPRLLVPNLVALIQRAGGFDAIPDEMDRGVEDLIGIGDNPWALPRWDAQLRDWDTGNRLCEFKRWGNDDIEFSDWHPHESLLSIHYKIPADWTAAPWEPYYVAIMEMTASTSWLEFMASMALNFWIEGIQKARRTLIHIQRDHMVF
jgi:hypothetical protein